MTAFRIMRRFSSLNLTASVLLFLSAIIAVTIANSPVGNIYQEFLFYKLQLSINGFDILSRGGESMTVLDFVNDGLMTVFFLLIGLEIKREVLVGELSSFRQAVLPFIAACGGDVGSCNCLFVNMSFRFNRQ